jgi:hypothetical protein
MSIKPIDMQTNISQMHEVGRNEQARNEGIAEQQHVLDKEANEKSKLVNTRLDESKKGEQTKIMDEEKNEKKHNQDEDSSDSSQEKKKKKELSHDDRMGRIIDILK